MDRVADRGLKVASSSSALSTSHYRDFGYLALITLLRAVASHGIRYSYFTSISILSSKKNDVIPADHLVRYRYEKSEDAVNGNNESEVQHYKSRFFRMNLKRDIAARMRVDKG